EQGNYAESGALDFADEAHREPGDHEADRQHVGTDVMGNRYGDKYRHYQRQVAPGQANPRLARYQHPHGEDEGDAQRLVTEHRVEEEIARIADVDNRSHKCRALAQADAPRDEVDK